jgi:hypothetical protein
MAMRAAFGHSIDPPLPTPLSGQIEPVRAGFSFSLGLLAIALGGGAILQFFGTTGARRIFEAVKLTGMTSLDALFAALASAVLLHESGHLVAALMMRFEILGIGLGPLRVSRTNGKWTVRPSGRLFSASISAVPRNMERWRERMLVVIAGGPMATLLTGWAAALMFFLYPPQEWTRTFLAALVQLSCFLFLLGLIPNGKGSPIRNDARLFLTFWNETQEAREIFLYHLVVQLKISGISPRNFPEQLIRTIAAVDRGRPDSMRFYAQTVELWARGRNDEATAEAWLARAGELGKFGLPTRCTRPAA